MRDRTKATFALGVLGLVILGLFRPSANDPQEDVRVEETIFFLQKARGEKRCDLVILGDSRALRGLSPSTLTAELSGIDAVNLAFNAGGMNDEIYRLAERRLDRDAPVPIVVLAPSALAYQPWKRDNAQYREYAAKPVDTVLLHLRLPQVARFFNPVPPELPLIRLLDVQPRLKLEQSFHRDGWIESYQTPTTNEGYPVYLAEHLKGTSADREIIAEMLDRVARWSDEGILVVGLRPPCSAIVDSLENDLLDYDAEAVAERFREAGGIWLEAPREGWSLYDGSHMDGGSAREFSTWLGRSLAALPEISDRGT